MTIDYKKQQKSLYQPKTKPSIIFVPSMQYLGVYGQGDPNDANSGYQEAIQSLYAVSYTLKMSDKQGYVIEGFEPYVVPPLEGFWWQEGLLGYDKTRKDLFSWLMVIRVPDFIQAKDVEWAKNMVLKKKKRDVSDVSFMLIEEGLCVQMMHIGPFDKEIHTVNAMNAYIQEAGFKEDFNASRRHHEIYLSDIRKVDMSKWKTVVRHPIQPIKK